MFRPCHFVLLKFMSFWILFILTFALIELLHWKHSNSSESLQAAAVMSSILHVINWHAQSWVYVLWEKLERSQRLVFLLIFKEVLMDKKVFAKIAKNSWKRRLWKVWAKIANRRPENCLCSIIANLHNMMQHMLSRKESSWKQWALGNLINSCCATYAFEKRV